MEAPNGKREQGLRRAFEALSRSALSRNRFFLAFAGGELREAHRRFRRLSGIQRDAERLSTVPRSYCRATVGKAAIGPGAVGYGAVGQGAVGQETAGQETAGQGMVESGRVVVRLESPALHYRREAEVLAYEWEWLKQQPGMQVLLQGAGPELILVAGHPSHPEPQPTA